MRMVPYLPRIAARSVSVGGPMGGGMVRYHGRSSEYSVGRHVGAPVGIAPRPGTLPSFDTFAGNRMRLRQNPAQEGMRVPLPLVIVGATFPIANAATATMTGRPQGLFRVSKLVVGSGQDTTAGFGVTVTSIQIGVDTCMAQLGPVSAAIFQATGVDCSVTFPTAPTALDCSIVVTNVTGTTATIFAQFMGEFLKGGHMALDG